MTDTTTTYTIQPTNGRPAIRFEGRLLAEASGWREGRKRWTILKAYQTKSGRWVIEQIGMTEFEGEETFTDVLVFDNADEMTSKMGFTRLSEDLWRKLGFDTITIS